MLRFPSLNFGQIANYISGIVPDYEPLRRGFLIPLPALFAVVAMAGLYQAGVILLPWLGSAITASLMAISIPYAAVVATFALTFVGLAGVAALNFWFRKELLAVNCKSREVTPAVEQDGNRVDFLFDNDNPIDLRAMVRHLVDEVNAYHQNKLGAAHKKLYMPRVDVFTDHHPKIYLYEGHDRYSAALYLSSGLLKSHDTGFNQRELAALLAVNIVKMYQNYGMVNMAISMAVNLMDTLRTNWPASLVGAALLGVNLGWMVPMLSLTLLLVPCAIKRAQTVAAAKVVVELGRGVDLIDANNRKVIPSQEKQGTRPGMARYKEQVIEKRRRRAPLYSGFLESWIKPIQEWIDKNDRPGDNQRSSRWDVLFGILVREGGLLIAELFQEEPRNTNLNKYLREITKNVVTVNEAPKEMSVEQATSEQMIADIAKQEVETKNRPVYNLVRRFREEKQAEKNRARVAKGEPEIVKPLRFYAPISPEGDGYAAPLPEKHVRIQQPARGARRRGPARHRHH